MSRSSVPTLAQQQRLLECLEEQRWLATGHARTSNARERTSAAWQEIANKLNSDGRGCIKSAKQWTKYWKDKKSAVRKKYRQIRLARMQTGGGGAEEELVLSAIEDRIVALMGGERFAVGDRELEINPFHPSTNESEAVPAAPPLEMEEEVQLVIQDVVTDSDATASESVLQDLIESMAVEPGTSGSTGQRLSIAPETRVCERVDEVDCTKSEKFYILNLELYGSTVPPVIQEDIVKTQVPTEQMVKKIKPSSGEADPIVDESSTTNDKEQERLMDVIDSTEDPKQDIKKDKYSTRLSASGPGNVSKDYQEDDGENTEYEEDYSHSPTTTTTSTTTRQPPPTTTVLPSTKAHRFSSTPQHISPPSPTLTSVPLSASPAPLSDSALLSPQEFIYRHRASSEAVSFQSFRPADGVYITHAPPQQYDHFQYESSRTVPRPCQPKSGLFLQRLQPTPFWPTTLDPRDQLLRPGPASQSSERHETSVKHRTQSYPPILPVQRPLPFKPYYYERKRSDNLSPEVSSSLTARSVSQVTERPPTKPKNPPRVIVTASASVSDSNGKRLNYTVGNVVSAVKPIVPINYEDYKESDLIFDPFFLDVPKLKKTRKSRSKLDARIFTVPATVTIAPNLPTEKTWKTTMYVPVMSRATATARSSTTPPTTTTTVAWNPNDYVDDNYAPHAYVPPAAPPAVLVAHETSKYKKNEKAFTRLVKDKKGRRKPDSTRGRVEQPSPTVSATQTTSSQIKGAGSGTTPPAALPPPPPPSVVEGLAYSCATSSRSTDCQMRNKY